MSGVRVPHCPPSIPELHRGEGCPPQFLKKKQSSRRRWRPMFHTYILRSLSHPSERDRGGITDNSVNLPCLYMRRRSQNHRIRKKICMRFSIYLSWVSNNHDGKERQARPAGSHKSNYRDHRSTYFQERKLRFETVRSPIRYQAVPGWISQRRNITSWCFPTLLRSSRQKQAGDIVWNPAPRRN